MQLGGRVPLISVPSTEKRRKRGAGGKEQTRVIQLSHKGRIQPHGSGPRQQALHEEELGHS